MSIDFKKFWILLIEKEPGRTGIVCVIVVESVSQVAII